MYRYLFSCFDIMTLYDKIDTILKPLHQIQQRDVINSPRT